jgi:hypothetical protein
MNLFSMSLFSFLTFHWCFCASRVLVFFNSFRSVHFRILEAIALALSLHATADAEELQTCCPELYGFWAQQDTNHLFECIGSDTRVELRKDMSDTELSSSDGKDIAVVMNPHLSWLCKKMPLQLCAMEHLRLHPSHGLGLGV